MIDEGLRSALASLSPDLFYFNGVDISGEYAIAPAAPKQVADWALGKADPEYLGDIQERLIAAEEEATREAYIDVSIEAQGWGVIFAGDPASPDQDTREIAALKEALKPLLAWRFGQAGDYYHELKYFPGVDTTNTFFKRRQMSPAEAPIPSQIPYYLLIVGSPDQIPYNAFQYPLDVTYAVGRIHFPDGKGGHDLDAYAEYARRVVAAESQPRRERRLSFFAPYAPGDQATILSAGKLVAPLVDRLPDELRKFRIEGWTVDAEVGRTAVKDRLKALIGGDQTPALLFTASHGVEFPLGNPLQGAHQGALLCADWAGPGSGAINPDQYFAGEDVRSDVDGMIAFHFACFSAGTPDFDDYSQSPRRIAAQSFTAALPSALLRRGALAAVGHVERAWGTSFMWEDLDDPQIMTFQSALQNLMAGESVGYAMQSFNERYARLATGLQGKRAELQRASSQIQARVERELAFMWTANNDARSYVIIGDPAVHVSVGAPGEMIAPAPARVEVVIEAQATVNVGALPSFVDEDARFADRPPDLSADSQIVDYGLLDDLRGAKAKLTEAIQRFADQIGRTLSDAIENVTTLEVETYVAPSGTPVTDDPTTMKLRAKTIINIDGDAQSFIPERSGELDSRTWNMHLAMVQQAQSYRADMIKAMAAAAAELVKAVRG
jgi:hypothetical protein